jgi:hypothetical protein
LDLLEMTLVIASFWLVMPARQPSTSWRLRLGTGVLVGTDFVIRETTLLHEFGSARLFPADILRKIERPGDALVVYRIPAP